MSNVKRDAEIGETYEDMLRLLNEMINQLEEHPTATVEQLASYAYAAMEEEKSADYMDYLMSMNS